VHCARYTLQNNKRQDTGKTQSLSGQVLQKSLILSVFVPCLTYAGCCFGREIFTKLRKFGNLCLKLYLSTVVLNRGTRTPWGYEALKQGVRTTNFFLGYTPRKLKKCVFDCCECCKLYQRPYLELLRVQIFL